MRYVVTMKTLREITRSRKALDVAAELGYSASYLSLVLSGRRQISGELLRRCVDVYGDAFDVRGTLLDDSPQASDGG